MIGGHLAHYRIVARLGAGGMGQVYRAEDLQLKRQVALKVLPEQYARDPRQLERFRQEAECIAALNHPNIVTVHSLEEDAGSHFITMELVEGRTLAELISQGELSLASFLSIAVPLVDAVSVAHEAGVIHRDLKPGNVMITARGSVKVLDFGLAKLQPGHAVVVGDGERPSTALTEQGTMLGTVPYMSPEQVRGEPADQRSDIFALGAMLHEMATGKRLFRGRAPADVFSAILRDEAVAISELRPDLPLPLGRMIHRCLEKEPESRFQSVQELGDELRALASDVDTATPWPPTSERAAPRRPPASRRGRWFAAAALAVVLAAAVVWWLAPGGERLPGGSAYDSLAVLPFANLTGQPAQDYVGEGIALAVITRLSEVGELRVASQPEAWSYRDQDLTMAQLGQELAVDLILQGDVQRNEELLSVNVRLAETRKGTQLWGRTFSAPRQEIIDLQRQIAAALTGILDVPLSIRERYRLAKDPTRSFRAYDFYLQGEQFLQAVGDTRRADLAEEIFRKALDLDPDFVLAHVGLSEALWTLYERDGVPGLLRRAEQHAERAMELDPALPAAQVAIARILRTTGRLGQSIAELRQVLSGYRAPDEALRELAYSYERIGRIADSEQSLRQAVALNPAAWHSWNSLGSSLLKQGKHADAREAFLEAARRAPPDLTWPRENLAVVKMYEGDFQGAVEELEAIGGETDDYFLVANLGSALFYDGRLDKAEEYYRLAVRLSPGYHEAHWGLGDVLAEKGALEAARREFAIALSLVEDAMLAAPEDPELELAWSFYAAKAADCDAAVSRLAGLEHDLPATGGNAHRQAHVYALCGRTEQAMAAIAKAIELGESRKLMRKEVELRALRELPEFLRLTDPR